MYKILTLCLILAQPIVFQDKGGKVYIIDDKVRREKGKVDVPGDDVLTLVDADGSFCIPDPYLLDAVNLRILLASSPRNRKDRSWLEQSIRDVSAVFVMEPWTRRELLVTSFVHSAQLIRPLILVIVYSSRAVTSRSRDFR
jgi:hypothetical protein